MPLQAPLTQPGGQPFFLPAGRTGVLLVHGFTGAPNEMVWLGEYLQDQGFTVLGVRLAGHGTHPDDLSRSTWRHWLASLEDGLAILASVTDRQFIGGLSMGGALALMAAAVHPVAGCIALSSIFAMPEDWRVPYIRPISRLMPRIGKGDAENGAAPGSDHVHYPFYPTIALAELRDLLLLMRKTLPAVRVPVFLAHSRLDTVVQPVNMERIHQQLTGTHVEQFWLHNSGHLIVREPERDALFAAIADFIRRHEGQAA